MTVHQPHVSYTLDAATLRRNFRLLIFPCPRPRPNTDTSYTLKLVTHRALRFSHRFVCFWRKFFASYFRSVRRTSDSRQSRIRVNVQLKLQLTRSRWMDRKSGEDSLEFSFESGFRESRGRPRETRTLVSILSSEIRGERFYGKFAGSFASGKVA